LVAPDWTDNADSIISIIEHVGPKTFDGPPTYEAHLDERYRLAESYFRWAVWCVESLYELRDLIDIADARGDNRTPQGHRTNPVAMGHVMWTAVTAIGALDRVGAAFGALYFPPLGNGIVHDFGSFSRATRQEKHRDLVRENVRGWVHDVEVDPAYVDLLSVFRHVMAHRTTPMALYGRAFISIVVSGEPRVVAQAIPTWEERPPHQDAPEFYLTDNLGRSIGEVELLDEVIPSVERHVRAALELVRTGRGLPEEVWYQFRDGDEDSET
jgi:hypothetical protein